MGGSGVPAWGPSARILVTGATGRLGREVARQLDREVGGDRLLLTASRPGRLPGGRAVTGLDLADHLRLATVARAHRPDVILHLGATPADAAERAPFRALDVDVLATAVLRDVADELGAHLVYPTPSVPATGHAGRTKRLAELVVLGDGTARGDGRHTVARLPGPDAAPVAGAAAVVAAAATCRGGLVDPARTGSGAAPGTPAGRDRTGHDGHDGAGGTGRARPATTVLVPAHQCESDLARCLASLGVQTFVGTGDLRVVTVANGCTDATAHVARRWSALLRPLGVDARVLDLQDRGRAVAFNAGEAHAGAGPRVYLDSNAALSPGALADLADVLGPGSGERFASLALTTVRPRSRVSRAYIRLWRATPYVARTGSTTGMYAVSEAGRRRWDRFPVIHSDDKYARLLFARHERVELPSSTYCVELPEGAVGLYRARVRYERGNRELARAFPALLAGEPRRYAGIGSVVLRRPDLWGPAACVALVQAAAVTRVRWPGRAAFLRAAGPS